jgi:hypothetical protein
VPGYAFFSFFCWGVCSGNSITLHYYFLFLAFSVVDIWG